MSTEDPWDAPDPAKLRITANPATRKLQRPAATPARAPASPPPHHASPTPEHGVVDEAAVEAPPIPRPEQPRAPKPAMIDTRVSQGQTPVAMVDGLEGASWAGVDEAPPGVPKPPAVRPWARNAGITIGVVAILLIFGTVLYVLGMGAVRAIQESDPERPVPVPVVAPVVTEEPKEFPDPLETSIIEEGEVPPQPIELPPEVDPYGGDEIELSGATDDEPEASEGPE